MASRSGTISGPNESKPVAGAAGKRTGLAAGAQSAAWQQLCLRSAKLYKELARRNSERAGRAVAEKGFAALLVSFLAFSILQIRELLLIQAYYSPWALAAPANSLTFFAHLPQGVSLGLVCALYLLARFAVLFAAASVVLLISSLCRKANTAMLASAAVLALPAALSYMGIGGFDALSFSKPMSPLSCSFLQYSTFLIVGLLALFGSRWKAGPHEK